MKDFLTKDSEIIPMKESEAWKLLAEEMFLHTQEFKNTDYMCNAAQRMYNHGQIDYPMYRQMMARHVKYPELLGNNNIPKAWLSFDFDDPNSVGHAKHCFYRQLTALWYALEAKEEGL